MRGDGESDGDKIADALNNIATSLNYLGNGSASTPLGALESHSMKLAEAIESAATTLSISLDGLAEAIRENGK